MFRASSRNSGHNIKRPVWVSVPVSSHSPQFVLYTTHVCTFPSSLCQAHESFWHKGPFFLSWVLCFPDSGSAVVVTSWVEEDRSTCFQGDPPYGPLFSSVRAAFTSQRPQGNFVVEHFMVDLPKCLPLNLMPFPSGL